MAFDLTALPPPDVIETLDYDAILTEILTWFRSMSPLYTNTVQGDPAYTVLQAMAYRDVMTRKRINDAARAVLVTHAIGADLDNLGVPFGLYRIRHAADPDATPPTPAFVESDERFRKRIITHLDTLSIGSEGWYKKRVFDINDTLADNALKIKDVAVRRGSIGGVIRLWVQPTNTANFVLKTDPLIVAVQNYFSAKTDAARARRTLGDTVEVDSVAVKSYQLDATVVVTPGFTATKVVEETLKRAKAFVLEREIIGQEIPLSHIYAALIWEGVAELTLTAPVNALNVVSNVVPNQGGIIPDPKNAGQYIDQVPQVPVASNVNVGLTP